MKGKFPPSTGQFVSLRVSLHESVASTGPAHPGRAPKCMHLACARPRAAPRGLGHRRALGQRACTHAQRAMRARARARERTATLSMTDSQPRVAASPGMYSERLRRLSSHLHVHVHLQQHGGTSCSISRSIKISSSIEPAHSHVSTAVSPFS